MGALFRNVGKWGICGGIVFVWGFPQIPYVYGWLGAACTLPIVVGVGAIFLLGIVVDAVRRKA